MKLITDILDYTLFSYKDYELTVFSILSVIVIFLIARLFLWGLNKILHRNLSQKAVRDAGRRHSLMQISRYVAYSVASIIALQTAGANLSVLLAGSAALLVGIGFGLQNTFNDFISGIIILFDGSIEVNDVIQVDNLVGRIKRIGIRATTIDTRDSISVIVPNSKFTQGNVINWSHNNKLARFSVTVGVAYGSDVEKVVSILEASADQQPNVLKNPPPSARFLDFGDSALLFEILFYTEESFLVEFIKSDIRIAIDKAFRQQSVTIPFPQRDLHIISDKRRGKSKQANERIK